MAQVGTLISVSSGLSIYKAAKCKDCCQTIKKDQPSVSVVRAQGRFNSVSNYCLECGEKVLSTVTDEITKLLKKVIDAQEKLDTLKIANEAFTRYGSTMKILND